MRETHDFKVVVAGPFASGKTTLIAAISDVAVAGTEQPTSGAEASVKATTTVGAEYGRYTLGDDVAEVHLHLHGVPGQERFSFMWDIAGEGRDGVVLVVDATDPSTWAEAGAVGRHLASGDVPLVVAANRAASATTLPTAEALGLDGATVVPCEVTDVDSARTVLVEVLLEVLDRMEDHRDDELAV